MAHPFTPLFLLAAVAFAAPDALATPVQGLRGAISNSTGEARHLSDPGVDVESSGNPGDGVESGGGMTCCKNGDDSTNCKISTIEGIMVVCKDKVDGSNCGIHGFTAHCCPESDVGIAWFLGGCH